MTGINYLNNRYHDPTLGQFISVDPLVTMTGEAYIYANANPGRYSDPTGLFSACEFNEEGELICAVDPDHVEYHAVQFGRATPRFWEAFAQQYRRTELDGTSQPPIRGSGSVDPEVDLGFKWGHLAALEAKGLSPELWTTGDGDLAPFALLFGTAAAFCGAVTLGSGGASSPVTGPCVTWAGGAAVAAGALDVTKALVEGEDGARCQLAVEIIGAALPGHIDEFAVETAGFEVINYFFGYTAEAC